MLLLFIYRGTSEVITPAGGGHPPRGRRYIRPVLMPKPLDEDEDGLFVVRIL